jgi:hypothetical protein
MLTSAIVGRRARRGVHTLEEACGPERATIIEERRGELGYPRRFGHEADVRHGRENRQPRTRCLGQNASRRRLSVPAAAQLEQFDGVLQRHTIRVAQDNHRLVVDVAHRVVGTRIVQLFECKDLFDERGNLSGVGESRRYSASIGDPANTAGVACAIA